MKRALLALCGFVLIAAIPPKTRTEQVAEYLRADPSNSDLRVVKPDIRESVIALLKNYHKVNAPNSPEEWNRPPDSTSRTILLRLHDQETVETFIRGIKDWAAGRERGEAAPIAELPDTRDASFIPHFSEDFLREDGSEIIEHTDQDVGWYEQPRSTDIAINVLKLIASSHEFNTATRKWAETYGDTWAIKQVGVAAFRQVLREWWEDNKRVFQTKDYQAVTPGRSLPLPAQIAVETTHAPLAAVAPETSKHTPTAQAFVASAAESSRSSVLLWTGTAAAIALFAGLLFFWKRRT